MSQALSTYLYISQRTNKITADLAVHKIWGILSWLYTARVDETWTDVIARKLYMDSVSQPQRLGFLCTDARLRTRTFAHTHT